MEEAIKDIFKNLQNSEMAFLAIGHILGKQKIFNRNVALLAAIATVRLIANEHKIKSMGNQIEKLQNEFNKLKETSESQ